jgi:hypothetical protein
MNMMPLRGLPFGVRLTARLGFDVPAMLTLGPFGQPRQGPNAGEVRVFACRSMRRLHAKRQPWPRRLPMHAKCNRRPTRTHLLRMTSRARACGRRNRALAAAGRTAHDALGSPCPQECSAPTNQFTFDRAAAQQRKAGDRTSSAACIALRMTASSH